MDFTDSSQSGERITLPRLAVSLGFVCRQDKQGRWVIQPQATSQRPASPWFLQQHPDGWLLVVNGSAQILMQKPGAIAFLKRHQSS